MRIAIAGARDGSHIGGSLQRAALALGHEVAFFDTHDAFQASAPRRHLHWRLLHRPPRLQHFSNTVVTGALDFGAELLLATGLAPLNAEALLGLRRKGVQCINYLTDDPWNPAFRAGWLFEAVASYDRVFSPRRSNLNDLRQLGARDVRYLPFGYDADIFYPGEPYGAEHDVVFAGGADRDRFPLLRALLAADVSVGLYGAGWARVREFRAHARGLVEPVELKHLVAASALALCIVRRANRDGHVMRTFELPAMRACMLVEDTEEQRAILGDTVAYFHDVPSLLQRVHALLADGAERERLADAAYTRITAGQHTYADRLRTLLGLPHSAPLRASA
jgi:spore maturation protein CgeB